jgi:DNA polymerase III delta subunit
MQYLLSGANALALDERVAELRAELDPAGLNTVVFYVPTSELSDIAAACQIMPFFGGSRVVVLLQPIGSARSGEASEADDAGAAGRVKWSDLLQVLKAVPASTTVIIRHDGTLGPGHYARKALAPLGWRCEDHPNPQNDDLLDWVDRRMRRSGATVSYGGAQLLLDLLFPEVWQKRDAGFSAVSIDMRLLATEIEKLACATPDGIVTEEIVAGLVADRGGFTAFKVNDDILSGKTMPALVELDRMLEYGEPPERVLPSLASELAARSAAFLAQEFGPSATARAAGVTDGRMLVLQKKSAQLGRAGVQQLAERLRSADASIKLGHAPDTEAIVVPLVAELAEIVRTQPAARGGRSRRGG